MPHEMGYCDCGREIHWPRTARYGDKWRCYNCGRRWELAPARRGCKPGYLVQSRRPEPKPRVVVVQVAAPRQVPFLPPGSPQLRALPAPRRRGGLLAWLLGE
jgi:hypothetical protein